MRGEFGYCVVCDKEIAKQCESCTHKKPTRDYSEVQVEWSNGSKMKVAVCVSCASSHAWATEEGKRIITQAHWDVWESRGGKYDKEIVIV